MKLFINTFLYKYKISYSTFRGLFSLILGIFIASIPFIGLTYEKTPVTFGWIDEDKTYLSELLKQNLDEIGILTLIEDDENLLMSSLKTGKIEGVLVIEDGFENDIEKGLYKQTVKLLQSPYSTKADLMVESVSAEIMRLWITNYTANIALDISGEQAYNETLMYIDKDTTASVLSLKVENVPGFIEMDKTMQLVEASWMSFYLLAAFVCFFILVNGATLPLGKNFSARLISRNFSLEKYRLAAALSDATFILPCLVPSLIGFLVAGENIIAITIIAQFLLYAFSYGGISSLLCKISDKTTLMLSICLMTIINILFGSMLVKLPSVGVISWLSYALPSRWLSSYESLGLAWSSLGIFALAVFYNILPFVFKGKERIK